VETINLLGLQLATRQLVITPKMMFYMLKIVNLEMKAGKKARAVSG